MSSSSAPIGQSWKRLSMHIAHIWLQASSHVSRAWDAVESQNEGSSDHFCFRFTNLYSDELRALCMLCHSHDMPISAPKSITKCKRFFVAPVQARQRIYEAMRAYFVEKRPSTEVTQAFGFTSGSFRVLCHQFRHNPAPEFFVTLNSLSPAGPRHPWLWRCPGPTDIPRPHRHAGGHCRQR